VGRRLIEPFVTGSSDYVSPRPAYCRFFAPCHQYPPGRKRPRPPRGRNVPLGLGKIDNTAEDFNLSRCECPARRQGFRREDMQLREVPVRARCPNCVSYNALNPPQPGLGMLAASLQILVKGAPRR